MYPLQSNLDTSVIQLCIIAQYICSMKDGQELFLSSANAPYICINQFGKLIIFMYVPACNDGRY